MRKILVAIDQGGSKTEIVLMTMMGKLLYRANDSEIRASNPGLFEQKRWGYIDSLVKQTLLEIGSSVDEVEYLLTAVCGADWDKDYTTIQKTLSNVLKMPATKIIVKNDCTAALRACLPVKYMRQNCAVIYAGTMFNCSLLSESDVSYTYGQLVNGNDHGAFALGQSIWKAILDSYNGFQEATVMERLFLEWQNADSIQDVIKRSSNQGLFSPTSCLPILFQAVNEGDTVANEIIDHFVRRWVQYVVAGIPKVGLTKESAVNVYLSGGVFKNQPQLWLERITNELNRYGNHFTCYRAPMEPIGGALLLLLETINQRPLSNQAALNITGSSIFDTLTIANKTV